MYVPVRSAVSLMSIAISPPARLLTRPFVHRTIWAFMLSGCVLLSACGGSGSGPEWTALDHEAVTGTRSEERGSIDVDIYIDGTTSMIGYTTSTSSEYLTFLDRLEATIETGWVDPEINFFKFGTRVREIDRAEYRQVRDAGFYREAGIFRRTNIDRVIERTDTSRVSIVVTDLFQNDQDMTRIVSRIRDRCLQQGVKVGVIGIPSSFDGRVYDARVGPYRYASTAGSPSTYRPFYALVFGRSDDLRLLTETLVSQQIVPDRSVLLVSDHLTRRYTARMQRARQAAGLNRSANGNGDFNFIMNADVADARLTAHVARAPYASAPGVNPDNLRLVVRRQEVTGEVDADALLRDAEPTSNLRGVEIDAVRDTARIELELQQEPGTYLYRVALEAPMPGALEAPAWVNEFSSANPSPSRDANKTLNLEPFVQGLLDAHATINRPIIALFDVQVRKRE
jgi:hypothetical protein